MPSHKEIAAHGEKVRQALEQAKNSEGPYTIFRQPDPGPETTYVENISEEVARKLMELLLYGPYKHHQT